MAQGVSSLIFPRGRELAYRDVEIGSLVGSGGFGHVHHARWRGQQVVMRELTRAQRRDARQLLALSAQAQT